MNLPVLKRFQLSRAEIALILLFAILEVCWFLVPLLPIDSMLRLLNADYTSRLIILAVVFSFADFRRSVKDAFVLP